MLPIPEDVSGVYAFTASVHDTAMQTLSAANDGMRQEVV